LVNPRQGGNGKQCHPGHPVAAPIDQPNFQVFPRRATLRATPPKCLDFLSVCPQYSAKFNQ
jgi:hypothetical protein